MKAKRLGLILAISAVVLLVGTMVAGLWPVKSNNKTSCGSFLAASSSVYNDAYQRQLGELDELRSTETQAQRQVRTGLDMLSGRDQSAELRQLANLEVTECADKRQTGGIVAGVLLLLALGAGGASVYLTMSGRGRPASTT